MDKFRIQAATFCGIATIAVISSFIWQGQNSSQFLLVLCLAVTALGVPHGSFDTLYAKILFGLNGFGSWILFGIVYLFLVLLVILAWKDSPFLFFSSFLIISTIHFSEDLDGGYPFFTRILYGGSILVLPFLLHSVQTTGLFALIIPLESAAKLQSFIKPLSLIWLGGSICSIAFCFYRKSKDTLSILSLCILAICVQPLLAFTVYFCVMHSPRHILRTFEFGKNIAWKTKTSLAVLPTILVFLGFILFAKSLSGFSFESSVLQAVFVGLAALTVPHMLLLAVKKSNARTKKQES